MSYRNNQWEDAEGQYQLQSFNNTPPQPLPFNEFLALVDKIRTSIRELSSSIQNITSLHQQALSSADPTGSRNRIQQASDSIQDKGRTIRDEIAILKGDAERTPDDGYGNGNFTRKKAHVDNLTAELRRELQRFRTEEFEYQKRCREQFSRQYRIANPAATEDEINAAVASRDPNGESAFQSAVCAHSFSELGSR